MNSPAFDPSALAGRVILRPGPLVAGRPTITNTRPDWVSKLAAGRQAAHLPNVLASVFTLCGHAHHWMSRRAILAAQGQTGAASSADVLRHRLATLREHLLRISHDWPRWLPDALPLPDATLLLRACPVWREDLGLEERLHALPEWLAQKWLGQPLTVWLQGYDADPHGWVAHWMQHARTPLARLLHGQKAALMALNAPTLGVEPLSRTTPTAMPLLARHMATPGFCARPHWQGCIPDTGPWNRHADPHRRAARTAWDRLVARLVEVLRLAHEPGHAAANIPGGARWLGHGALTLGAGVGLAWVEMARGLLVHRVQLADGSVVQDCQVLAPTEWNFHPQGVLAQALRALPSGLSPADLDAAARRLAVAFDPCVAFDVEVCADA